MKELIKTIKALPDDVMCTCGDAMKDHVELDWCDDMACQSCSCIDFEPVNN